MSLGLCITTNHKADGVYLETTTAAIWWLGRSARRRSSATEFWNEKWRWLRNEGGAGHVAAYLAQRTFRPSTLAPCHARLTPSSKSCTRARRPEDAEIADALDELGRPDIVTLAMLVTTNRGATLEWLLDKKHRRSIPYKMETCGYVAVRNPDAQKSDGLWKIDGRRQTLYGRASLVSEQRQQAARNHVLRNGRPR